MSENNSQPMIATVPAPSHRGALARIPILGDLGPMIRFFRDRNASLGGKAFVIATVAYIVMPADAIPDVAPIIGWLDDAGLAVVALAYLSRVIGKYRT